MSDTRRVELDEGGWWELTTRPSFKQALAIRKFAESGEIKEEDIAEVLHLLTAGWSFDEDVSLESVSNRRLDHVFQMLEVFAEDVAPFLESLAPRMNRIKSKAQSGGASSTKPKSSLKPSPKVGSRRATASSKS